jgi:hypothetical protein
MTSILMRFLYVESNNNSNDYIKDKYDANYFTKQNNNNNNNNKSD